MEAAQAGALWAQDELVNAYLPLVYNIVGRALNGHADVDDVVQETMLSALGSLSSLHHPAGFRSWVVAITMNQIRDHRHKQQATPAGSVLLDACDMAGPGADFVDLTILCLGLEGQRREVAGAPRWLDADDRSLLSLWWLESTGELSRTEVAAAVELSAQHTAVRVQRMKAQLETARLVVRALSATPLCARLDHVIGIWNGGPSPLWRKWIARHARDCEVRSGHQAGLVPAERLLVGLGLVPAAAALTGLAGLTALNGAGKPGRSPPTALRSSEGKTLIRNGTDAWAGRPPARPQAQGRMHGLDPGRGGRRQRRTAEVRHHLERVAARPR
ncbi:sigma-70 family RNA polymerase sigma factor [Streptomyces luteogriseus]|uniref:sigma-70 family RNA polymerase sigma factor n=1 Tax=Streptomyces luteogriseus TaxID=68233 RepID=UPI00379F8849